ncbi:hypothetical protein HN873_018235, partial [Arachis hypogaea]
MVHRRLLLVALLSSSLRSPASLLVAPVTRVSARRSGLPLLWSGLCSSLHSSSSRVQPSSQFVDYPLLVAV